MGRTTINSIEVASEPHASLERKDMGPAFPESICVRLYLPVKEKLECQFTVKAIVNALSQPCCVSQQHTHAAE